MDAGTLYALGIVLVFAGALIIILAFLLLLFTNTKARGKVRGGGAIIVGPIPIVFGTDKESLRTVLILSVALTVLLIVAMVIFYLVSR